MAKSKRKHREKRGSKSGGSNPRAEGGAPSRFSWYFVRVFPFVVLAVSLALWLGAKTPRGAAIAGGIGIMIWLTLALGTIGSQVPPRESTRGGAIDFGKRNN